MAHKLLIVGAGFGGNGVIHGLAQAYQKESGEGSPPPKALFPGDLEITMLDRNTSFSIGGTWQFIWSSRLTSSTILWPLVDLQANHFDNAKLITGPAEATVKEISTDQKKVILTNGKVLDYDTLVLAPGVISDPSRVPGLPTENASIKTALDFCNLSHVPLIKEAIDQTMKEAKTQKKTILVCVTRMPYKCPPVPFEVASIVDDIRRERGVKENVEILLSVPVPFPFAGPPVELCFKDLLKQQDITFLNNHVVKKVDGSTVYFEDISGESPVPKTIKADLLLATFPQRAPDFVQPLCNAEGYIPVDLQTNKVKAAVDVFAIGDVCHTMFPKPNKPHPKAGEFAYLMGVHVAAQIVANIKTPGTAVAPPLRQASCVAECGVAGRGVDIRPDFSEILRAPETGMPIFKVPLVDGAADKKIEWVNGYLNKFFAQDKVLPFGGSHEEQVATSKVDTKGASAPSPLPEDHGFCCLIS